ncbi:ribonuclease inhibitor-like, partial [Silurus meridionalis]|uniref:ribonuclease inhibitor-like n=1 Tax=Silurus meridionalis TaxID=175797 RepID=UPI001EEC7A45
MTQYIQDLLASIIICPSSSPAGAGLFFVEKKYKSLRHCIEYQGLNAITVKKRYPLPMMFSAFDFLQGSIIFTKLDLHSTTLSNVLYVKANDFHVSSTTFLGFVLLADNVQMDQARIQEAFNWNPEAELAFTKLKSLFTSAPVLTLPDPTRQFVVEVDGSDLGVGAILSQRGARVQPAPCAFFSHCLRAEQNYPVGDREILAVKLALKEWRHWLEGLRYCGVSDEGCAALASALKSNPSHLRKLNLTGNKVGDSGVKCLSAVLENPHCKLEILRLCDCGVSDEGCAALASALRSNPSHLRELNLSLNKVGDSGVKCLSAVLENPHCKLEILRLWDCGVSDEGCAALASALRSNPSHLRVLHLSGNKVGDSGVKCLSDLKDDERYKLQTLKLYDCGVSDEGCAALASALRSNPSHLRELNLSRNKVGDSGVKCLSAVLENPHCKLE